MSAAVSLTDDATLATFCQPPILIFMRPK